MKHSVFTLTALLLARLAPVHADDGTNKPANAPASQAEMWSHIQRVADLGELREMTAEWDASVPGGALRLVAAKPARYAWATVPAPRQRWNLARYTTAEAEITNRGRAPAEVMLWVVGDRGWDAVGDFATLAPGEARKFSCRLRATFPDGTPKLDQAGSKMFLDDRPSTQQLRRWFNDLVSQRNP